MNLINLQLSDYVAQFWLDADVAAAAPPQSTEKSFPVDRIT